MKALKSFIWPLSAVAALAVLMISLQAVGLAASRASQDQRVIEGKTAAASISELRAAGVRGRTVLVLDHRARIVDRMWLTRTMKSLSEADFVPPAHDYDIVSSMILCGIATEVLFVPPPALWGEQAARYGERSDSLVEGEGYRVRFYGVPVHLTTQDEVISRRDRLIVYASSELLGEYDAEFVKQVTDPSRCDYLIVTGEMK